jgi:hypothetical protein
LLGGEVSAVIFHGPFSHTYVVVGKNLQKPLNEKDKVPEIAALREKMHSALAAVRDKRNPFAIQVLRGSPFGCAASLIAMIKV